MLLLLLVLVLPVLLVLVLLVLVLTLLRQALDQAKAILALPPGDSGRELTEATSLIGQALKVEPGEKGAYADRALLYRYRARAFVQMEKWTNALSDFDRVIVEMPYDAASFLDRGKVRAAGPAAGPAVAAAASAPAQAAPADA